ncbi:hypothetical protein FCH28_17375 [Streptomyces piniterrae]|uniref:TPM domain-containing protein n=1 Tax=Streptomyces piniterrae TaxID=2571125 RepID=A0A4U0NFQ5_9ACTN|nr:hypothetical protein [Streptomyces piniterrae]TJZ52939.1 hypothetical protein FCH28_17375 [Streptomyces piniterrae]
MGAVRRAGMLLVVGWLAVLFTAGGAQAAPVGQQAPTQAAYLAERLRENPVYISDQIPREVPRSTAPEFAREARRLSVPTYVVVLPRSSLTVDTSGLLAGIHDRLGRKGLYVAVSESGLDEVETYGVSLPAKDASTATLYELPYDATARETFRHFVDVLVSGQAPQRAEAARARYGGPDASDEPSNLHTSHTDREDQSFLTGIAVTGIPLSALLITIYAWQRHRVRHAPGTAGPGPFPRARLIPLGAAALAVAGLLAFTASQIYDDTTSGDGARPTAADMRARIDRFADGLRRDPLYVDPETPSELDAAERAHLRDRLRSLKIPVLIAAVPTPLEDESRGSAELLAKSLHDRLHRDALYVIANPASGMIDLFNYGARIGDDYFLERPREIEYPRSADPRLGPRLDTLLTFVARTPPAAPGHPPYPPPPAEDPVTERALPGLFAGDFDAGLLVGTFAAGLLFGLVAAGCAVGRAGRRRLRPRPSGPARTPEVSGARTPEAPDRPSLSWLRRTARREVDALTAALESATSLSEERRRRAWECLDAAALLIDGESDGRIDADAGPADLACAIVLTRAGRASTEDPDAGPHVCGRNPLHGAARGRREIQPDGDSDVLGRVIPVCEACRETPGPMLRLRSSTTGGGDPYVPYPTLPGPLAALGDGASTDQLTSDVREHFGVH